MPFGNTTLDDIKKAINKVNADYHNLDVNKLDEFYLKNIDTTNSLALREAFYELLGDLIMKCPTYYFAKQFATSVQNRKNIYFYQVTYMSKPYAKQSYCDMPGMGICHCAETDFVFGQPFITPDIYTEVDRQFSLDVMNMWTNFAKYGYII
jgi:carboxylesterase type B